MTTIEVFIDDKGGVRPVGQAHFTRNRGQISTTFLYDPRYLSGDGMSIDPALPLVAGSHTRAASCEPSPTALRTGGGGT